MSTIVKRMEDLIYKGTIIVFLRRIMQKYVNAAVGLENLPKKGPYIIIANHESFADHFFLASVNHYLFRQKLFFLTRKESFDTFHSRLWHNSTGCIPIDRDKPDINSFRQIFKVLGEENVIVIYPEGTRGPGGYLLPFKAGAFKIAARMGVPIVPAGILGTRHLMPKGSRWFKNVKTKVVFGKPIQPDQIKKMKFDELMEFCKEIIEYLAFGENSPAFNKESQKIRHLI